MCKFIDGIINFQNILKKIWKIACRAVFAAAKKDVQKQQNFS